MDNVKLFHFIVVALAGWVNRYQQAIIDFLIEENRVFKQQLQGRRLRLSDNDRRRLAAKAKVLGRSVLDEIANLVTGYAACLAPKAQCSQADQWTNGTEPAGYRQGDHRVGTAHGPRKHHVGV